MSMSRNSSFFTSRSEESWCGRELFSPAGTMVGSDLEQLRVVLDTRLRIVVADAAAEALRGVGYQAPIDHHALELGGDLTLGPLRVTEVREEEALLGADERQPAAARKPGQPAQARAVLATRLAGVHEVADQQLVETGVGDERGQPVRPRLPVHSSNSSFSSSSASR